jgi:hypothetical protein
MHFQTLDRAPWIRSWLLLCCVAVAARVEAQLTPLTPDEAAVQQAYPALLVDEWTQDFGAPLQTVPRLYDFETVDLLGSGVADYIVAAYSNGYTGVVKVFQRQGNVLVALHERSDMAGSRPLVRLVDFDGDRRPEVVVSFSANGGSSPAWIFRWEGAGLQKISPSYTDDFGSEVPALIDPDFVDVDGDGAIEVINHAEEIPNGANGILKFTGDGFVSVVKSGENIAPTANAGADQTIEAISHAGAQATLSAALSSDPDGDLLAFSWAGPFGTLNGGIVTPTLPLGVTNVTLNVNDGRGGGASDVVTITVRDTAPPTVTPPASLSVVATEAGGARPTASVLLGVFLVDGSANDVVDPAPIRLTPQVSGTPVDGNLLFPVGNTTVTFLFRDASNNIGTATSVVTVTGPEVLACDVDADRDVDLGDLALIRTANGQASAVGDIRDANRDGAINVADVRYCQLRCSRPSCAP